LTSSKESKKESELSVNGDISPPKSNRKLNINKLDEDIKSNRIEFENNDSNFNNNFMIRSLVMYLQIWIKL